MDFFSIILCEYMVAFIAILIVSGIALYTYMKKNALEYGHKTIFVLDIWYPEKENQRWIRNGPDQIQNILKRPENKWMGNYDFYVYSIIIGKKGQIIHYFHDSQDIHFYVPKDKLKEMRKIKTNNSNGIELYCECEKCEVIYNSNKIKNVICDFCSLKTTNVY